MMTGLCFLPSKPLSIHPDAAATITTIEHLGRCSRGVSYYEMWREPDIHPSKHPTGVVLALTHDFAQAKDQITAAKLPTLPAVDQQHWANLKTFLNEDVWDDEPIDLPPELQPQAMDDGIRISSEPPSADAMYSCVDDDDMDAADIKNMEDFDPDQDSDQDEYIENEHGWIDADKVECLEGANLRLYEGFDVSKDTTGNSIYSDHYDSNPLDGKHCALWFFRTAELT